MTQVWLYVREGHPVLKEDKNIGRIQEEFIFNLFANLHRHRGSWLKGYNVGNWWENKVFVYSGRLNIYNALLTLNYIQHKAIMSLTVEWSLYLTAISGPHTNFRDAVADRRASFRVLCMETTLLNILPMHAAFFHILRQLKKTFSILKKCLPTCTFSCFLPRQRFGDWLYLKMINSLLGLVAFSCLCVWVS